MPATRLILSAGKAAVVLLLHGASVLSVKAGSVAPDSIIADETASVGEVPAGMEWGASHEPALCIRFSLFLFCSNDSSICNIRNLNTGEINLCR